MSEPFQHVRMSEPGHEKAAAINCYFNHLISALHKWVPQGREYALMVTKLQEARDVAIRGMMTDPVNRVMDYSEVNE